MFHTSLCIWCSHSRLYSHVYYLTDPLPPPANVSCDKTSSNGFEITWEAVVDDSCAMSQVEYNVTITRDSDIEYTMIVISDNRIRVSDVLQRGVSYNVSVSAARTVTGSCGGEPATILCQTLDAAPTISLSSMLLISQNVIIVILFITIIILLS